MNEILLYNEIYTYTASAFIERLEALKDKDVVIRINTRGGNPEDAFGMIAKLAERAANSGKSTIIKVDGRAYSMGAFLLCYCDKSEGLDASDFMFHRASYGKYIESNPDYMTAEAWASLDRVNALLRSALEAKIDVKKFEKLKGVTLDELFSNETRIDVTLTAQEALEVGLINKIVSITPEKKAEINKQVLRMAAEATGIEFKTTTDNTESKITKSNIMTLAQLKADHPEVYAQAVKTGVTEERDRVGAFMAFVSVDPEAVAKGIKDGDNITQTMMAEMTMKALSGKKLTEIKADNAPDVQTAEVTDEATAEAKSLSDFQAEVKKNLGLK